MEWKDLNKIPFLKDFDFTDERARKNFLLMVLAGVGILSYGTYTAINLFGSDKKKAARMEQRSEEERRHNHDSAVPAYPQGQSKEMQYDSRMDALADARRRKARTQDVWEQAGKSDFASIKSRFDSVAASGTSVTPTEQAGRKDEQDEAKKRYADRERRRREYLISQGIDPDTNLPLAYSSRKASSDAAVDAAVDAELAAMGMGVTKKQEPPKSEEPKKEPPAPVVMRRTSKIHSLDADNNNAGGEIYSLDNTEDQYISAADIHPIKVMFSSTAKIRSGQRIYLRLLEDIIVDGILVSKNTQLPALCTIGERISIEVNSLELNNKIYKLDFEGYDIDGGKGLYCPVSVANQNVKEGVEQATNIATSALSSAVQGYAGQVSNAGINIARRNANNTTVTISSGYTFFLVRKQ